MLRPGRESCGRTNPFISGTLIPATSLPDRSSCSLVPSINEPIDPPLECHLVQCACTESIVVEGCMVDPGLVLWALGSCIGTIAVDALLWNRCCGNIMAVPSLLNHCCATTTESIGEKSELYPTTTCQY